MEQVVDNSPRRISWCVTVIKHAAIRARYKRKRWERESLTLNNVTESGEEWADLLPAPHSERDFLQSECMLLLQTLPAQQFDVMYALFVKDQSQQEVAEQLNMSQQQVSRLKGRALTTLRERVMQEWIMQN